jgi:uncharacterized protein YcbK (DUF882 family)
MAWPAWGCRRVVDCSAAWWRASPSSPPARCSLPDRRSPSWAEGQPDRRLHLHNVNTLETIDVAYFRDGRYQPDALQQLSRFLRDYRSGRVARMDPGLYDYLHDVQAAVRLDDAQPTRIISAYRAPETNRARRSRDRSVARDSYHTRGQAFDVVLPDRDLLAVRAVAVKLERGGVGAYPRAGFLHLDVGPARTW